MCHEFHLKYFDISHELFHDILQLYFIICQGNWTVMRKEPKYNCKVRCFLEKKKIKGIFSALIPKMPYLLV